MKDFTRGLKLLEESNRLMKEHALSVSFRSRPEPEGDAARFLLDEMTFVWSRPPETIIQTVDDREPGETFCRFVLAKDAVQEAEEIRGGGLVDGTEEMFLYPNIDDVDDSAARIIPKRTKPVAVSSLLPDSDAHLGVLGFHLAVVRHPDGYTNLVGDFASDIAAGWGELTELLGLAGGGMPTAVWPTGAVSIRPDGTPVGVGTDAKTVCGWLRNVGAQSPVTALTSSEYTVVAGHADGSTSQLRLALPPKGKTSRNVRPPSRGFGERHVDGGDILIFNRIGDIIDLAFPAARPEGRPDSPVKTVVVSGNIIATLHADGTAHLSVRPELPAQTQAPPEGWWETVTGVHQLGVIPGRHIVVGALGGVTIFRCTPIPGEDPIPPRLHIPAPSRFHPQPYSADHGQILGRHHLVTATDGIHPVWLPSAEDIAGGFIGAFNPRAAILLPDGPSLRKGGGAWDEVSKTSGEGWAQFSTRAPLVAGDQPIRLLRSLGISPDDPTLLANLLPRRARDAKHIRLLSRLGA